MTAGNRYSQYGKLLLASRSLMSQRTFYGHGSIYRGTLIAVQHVGYSLAEKRSDGTVGTIGVVRGDPQVLRPMAQVNQKLVLMLEDGRRLPFRLTDARQDGGTWEIAAIGLPQ